MTVRLSAAAGMTLLAICLSMTFIAPAWAQALEKHTQRGPVSATVRLGAEEIRIGDAIDLYIEVTAPEQVEVLLPVFGASLERYDILEFVPRQSTDTNGNQVLSQHYRLQAPHSGPHRIPPITIEFVDHRPGERPAPEDEDAYELLTESLEFTVQSVVPAQAGDELRPLLGQLEPLAAPASPGSVGAGLMAVLVAILGLGWWLYRRIKPTGPSESPYERARRRLDALTAAPRPDESAMDAFFVELSDLVRRYLEDRFALHAPELTTEEFLDVAARTPDLTREHRAFLRDFLRRADRVKFARFVPDSHDVDGALDAVRQFLEQTVTASESDLETAGAGADAHV